MPETWPPAGQDDWEPTFGLRWFVAGTPGQTRALQQLWTRPGQGTEPPEEHWAEIPTTYHSDEPVVTPHRESGFRDHPGFGKRHSAILPDDVDLTRSKGRAKRMWGDPPQT